MQTRTLGTGGLDVSPLGMSCMAMSAGYRQSPDRQAMIAVLR
jgi:aryl-alcohol dehydrogenase-like predicted oxidoreductase